MFLMSHATFFWLSLLQKSCFTLLVKSLQETWQRARKSMVAVFADNTGKIEQQQTKINKVMRPLYFQYYCQQICRVHNDEKTQSPILCDWGCLRCVARGLVDLFQSPYWAGKLSGSFRHAQLQSGALASAVCKTQRSLQILRLKSWGSVTAKSVWSCQDATFWIARDVRVAVLWYKTQLQVCEWFLFWIQEQAPGL